MALALGAGSMVKGATGIGIPVVALPILATVVGLPHAIAVQTIPVLFTNIWQVWQFRKVWPELKPLKFLFLGGLVGIPLGTLLLTIIPERALSGMLALLLFLYIGLKVSKPHFVLSMDAGQRLAPVAGVAAGTMQAATGVSAPVSITFLHSLKLTRNGYLFAVALLFALFSVIQIPSLLIAGVMTGPILVQGLLSMIPVLICMPLGAWIGRRLSQRTFDYLVLVLLSVVGVQLLVEAIWG
nr:sulfite exporter TauE/SafE family protein [Propylenella binzhouense]